MKKSVFSLIAAIVMVLSVAATGCGSGGELTLDPVTVQLKWIHQAQFAGMYTADQKGFYAEENIDAVLKPGGNDIHQDTVFADLLAGGVDFAMVGGAQVIEARASGKPVVAVAAIFQKNPYVYVTLATSGIDSPQDLVGRKVIVANNSMMQHVALLKRLGIDPDTVEIASYSREVTPLVTGEVDASMVYRTSLGLAYDETGLDLNLIWVDDYGLHMYEDVIVTTELLVRQDPALVERFLRATMKGWHYAVERTEEAVDITLLYDPTLDRQRQALMMEKQLPLIHTGDAGIGWMEDSVWRQMQQVLVDSGILTQPIAVDQAYTMQFLHAIYGAPE